jgi:uncharacterized pyridoxal phosphate-containing UPF0001 family protein
MPDHISKQQRLRSTRLSTAGIANIEMRYLSMGMSNSYQIAIEEGINIVRIGNKLFGERYN